MNVLQKCCYRSLKENRKRAVVTIIGVLLATSLITAVACMVESFRASMLLQVKQDAGEFHYLFTGVSSENLKYFQNNQNISRLGLAQEMGYAMLPDCQNPDKPYLYIRALDDSAMEMLSLELCEGRMPENETEVVISRHIRSNGGVDLKVGDTLKLQVGSRVSEGYQLHQENPYVHGEEELELFRTETYTVVGMVERPNNLIEERTAPGYSVFTKLSQMEEKDTLEVYAFYTRKALKQADEVNAGLLGMSEEMYDRFESGEYEPEEPVARAVTGNYGLIRWELLRFSSTSMSMLYSMAVIAIVIIIVTSVFCIRNSFVISLTEKMKLYGRLASVGTTPRQQKKIIYYEAGILGIIGIPLGVLCGVLAELVLVQAIGGLMEDAMDLKMVFVFSWPAVLLGAVFSMITVFLSASGCARKAARVSPLSAIRANETIKIARREVKCPGWIGKVYGIGGKIAYKNLRRARVKYRTTVVSIVVSVAVFIGVSGFVRMMSYATRFYQEKISYQLAVSIEDEDWEEKARKISALDGIQEIEIRRTVYMQVDKNEVPYTREYQNQFGEQGEERDALVMVCALGQAGYESYLKRLGIRTEDAQDKAIMLNQFEIVEITGDGKRYTTQGEIADYRKGDVIRDKNTGTEVEVLAQTKETPIFMGRNLYNNIVLIVSDSWLESHEFQSVTDNVVLYIRCENADGIEEVIRRDMGLLRYTVTNQDQSYRSEQSTQMVVAIFLYGFIVVVTLIGVTNIFNTVTTNMELRAPEFAVLKSVGMTGREFRRMIWLEGLFYGGKSLAIGIPLGLGISYLFHKALGEGIEMAFRPPFAAVVIAAAGVWLLLSGIMWYSMGKINHRNLMETVQNENI